MALDFSRNVIPAKFSENKLFILLRREQKREKISPSLTLSMEILHRSNRLQRHAMYVLAEIHEWQKLNTEINTGVSRLETSTLPVDQFAHGLKVSFRNVWITFLVASIWHSLPLSANLFQGYCQFPKTPSWVQIRQQLNFNFLFKKSGVLYCDPNV